MNKKLKQLRICCTDKQAKFTELIHEGIELAEAYEGGGFQPKNKRIAQQAASRLLTTNTKVMDYLEALKDNDDRKTNISRTFQLKKLDRAYEIAESHGNPSAMVSAIREQNEMLGFHRDNAPNPEAEAKRKARLDDETAILRAFARRRTGDLAMGGDN